MQESSLGRISAVLRARWWIVVLLAIPILVTSIWYATSRPSMYRSETVLALTPGESASPDNSFVRLVPRYLIAATSRSTLRTAEAAAGLAQGTLANAVTAVNLTGSLEIELAATTGDPARTRAAVAALADSVLVAAEEDPLVDARVVQAPTEPADVTPTRQVVALGAGGLLALVPGVSLAFLLEGARPRVRTRADLERMGLRVVFEGSRRRLRGMAGGAPFPRHVDDVTGLRAHVAAGVREPGAAVVITSVTPAEAAEVGGVVDVLAKRGGHEFGSASGAEEATGGPRALPCPGLLSDTGTAQAAVLEHRACLLVLPAGVEIDRVLDCIRLLDRMGVAPIGAVFVR